MSSAAKSPRCLWCNEADGELVDVVVDVVVDAQLVRAHRAHEDDLVRFIERTTRSGWSFLGGIAVSLLLGVVAAALAATGQPRVAAATAAVATTVCGVVILRYPFATPETISLFGVKRSITMVRFCGVAILLLAVWLTMLAIP
ncbi:MAG: hypothetical protein ACRD2J_06390 [Thermoanaerobaculia bacterium]